MRACGRRYRQLGHGYTFFSLEVRENDYLWGRLDAAGGCASCSRVASSRSAAPMSLAKIGHFVLQWVSRNVTRTTFPPSALVRTCPPR
jgi:hypothetical protein